MAGQCHQRRVDRRLAIKHPRNVAATRQRQRIARGGNLPSVGQHRRQTIEPGKPAGLKHQALAAEIDDLALAALVDQYRRIRARSTGVAGDMRHINPLLREIAKDDVADSITPQTRAQHGVPAKPRHRNSGIASTTAAHHFSSFSAVFFGPVRQRIEVEDKIQNRRTNAKNLSHGATAVGRAARPATGGSGSGLPLRQARKCDAGAIVPRELRKPRVAELTGCTGSVRFGEPGPHGLRPRRQVIACRWRVPRRSLPRQPRPRFSARQRLRAHLRHSR